MLAASLLFAAGCSVASADQIAVPTGPRTALAIAPAKIRAPYDVQVLREDGEVLPTYALRDRFYVEGEDNGRYIIRITNPTANRVEAVVTVDGLDVVDGENGDLRKRGYVVPPYGETRIEGFRTSQADVATFRFSSVDGSYAGKKGKARNVGVIAVALFEEQPQQQIIQPQVIDPRPYRYEDDIDEGGEDASGYAPRRPMNKDVAKADKAPKKMAPPPPTATAPAGGVASRSNGAPRAKAADEADGDYYGGGGAPAVGGFVPPADMPPPVEQQVPQRGRMGLGTEFGEQRYSAATFTKFVRAANRPIAVAELRYNDAAGLTALGILVTPIPDAGEVMTRETADPFPGDGRFAQPPR